jgi:hypothetical protein
LIWVRPRSDEVFLSGRREIAEQVAVRKQRRQGCVGHGKALL